MTNQPPSRGSSTPGGGLKPRFTEQGVQVYELNDMEWWIGRDKESTIAAALAMWGIPREEAFDTFNPESGVCEVDLDKNTVNVHPDAEDGEVDMKSFREEVRRIIAAGEPIPNFFAGDR
jgi:hypothetical protein